MIFFFFWQKDGYKHRLCWLHLLSFSCLCFEFQRIHAGGSCIPQGYSENVFSQWLISWKYCLVGWHLGTLFSGLFETCLCPWPVSCGFWLSCIIFQFLLTERLNSTLGLTSIESSYGPEAWMLCYFLFNTIKHSSNCSYLQFDSLITHFSSLMWGKCFPFRLHNSWSYQVNQRIPICLLPHSYMGWI